MEEESTDSLAIAPRNLQSINKLQEVRVERDPETGKILRVIRPEGEEGDQNPLNDPLNDLSDEDNNKPVTGDRDNIIAQLEAQAAEEAQFEAKRKRPRQQSTREEEWLAELVEAHGDNTTAMFRDQKLNPMQQSEGDIARRLRKWKQKLG